MAELINVEQDCALFIKDFASHEGIQELNKLIKKHAPIMNLPAFHAPKGVVLCKKPFEIPQIVFQKLGEKYKVGGSLHGCQPPNWLAPFLNRDHFPRKVPEILLPDVAAARKSIEEELQSNMQNNSHNEP